MHKSNGSPSIDVSESILDISALLTPLCNDPTFKTRLQTAAVLIIPTDLRPEYDCPVFPDTTREVLYSLREGLGSSSIVEAAVRDEDYVEYQFNSEHVILPVLFVEFVLAPLVISLLASYVHDRLKKGRGRAADDRVTSEIHVRVANGKQFSLTYEGPADTYERVVSQAFRDLDLSSDRGTPPSKRE